MNVLSQLKPKWFSLFLLSATLLLSACGGGGSGGGGASGSSTSPQYVPTLYSADYYMGSYQYLNESYITGAPADTDWSRMGCLSDGANFRFYFMKKGTSDTLYQFAYNGSSTGYEYGYHSDPEISLTNIPADADSNSLAMAYEGGYYYAYMKSLTVPTRIYSFQFDGSTYAYQRSYNITKAPPDTDWSRWTMVYGDGASRFYTGKIGDDSVIYQFQYNLLTQAYEWGYGGAVSTIAVTDMPADSDTSHFCILYSANRYRFYYLNKQP